MLDEHVQQWTAIQTIRAARLNLEDVFMTFFALAGNADELEVEGYLSGIMMLPAPQRDLMAQAINELLDGTGSTADGAHYSDQYAASLSGYGDYLRPLNLSPDHYDFSAPPAGDHSTGSGAAAFCAAHATDPSGCDPLLDDVEFWRLHALYESRLLESGTEERFDRITRHAREHFGVSSASITLITEDLQVIKSVVGPLGQDLPRSLSLCARTIEQDRTLVIADAGTDPEWRDHPLVSGGPRVRFYAGHPVCTAEGWRIGTLCLMDDRPRTFTEHDAQALRRLASLVQMQM
ncbi:GAF domain-containing protein [Arthrobacter sp. MDB2-24]